MDLPQHPHLFFALFLGLQQLLLPRVISPVAFGSHILPQGLDFFLGYYSGIHLRPNRYFELFRREVFFEGLANLLPQVEGLRLVEEELEAVYFLIHETHF